VKNLAKRGYAAMKLITITNPCSLLLQTLGENTLLTKCEIETERLLLNVAGGGDNLGGPVKSLNNKNLC
jgi:hypothetical protein